MHTGGDLEMQRSQEHLGVGDPPSHEAALLGFIFREFELRRPAKRCCKMQSQAFDLDEKLKHTLCRSRFSISAEFFAKHMKMDLD